MDCVICVCSGVICVRSGVICVCSGVICVCSGVICVCSGVICVCSGVICVCSGVICICSGLAHNAGQNHVIYIANDLFDNVAKVRYLGTAVTYESMKILLSD
jgi:hypothetical protein